MIGTVLTLSPSVSLISAFTVYAPDCAYYLETCKDDRGFYVAVNGYHIRPLAEEGIDTRSKALQWTLELYRLYATALGF